jgi:hypothetical protein
MKYGRRNFSCVSSKKIVSCSVLRRGDMGKKGEEK